jgi:hypothetical protein
MFPDWFMIRSRVVTGGGQPLPVDVRATMAG